MSSSHNRFGRRTDRQNEEPRFEPQLSFNPKRPGARAGQAGPAPTANSRPQAGLHVDREDAREFGISFGEDDDGVERHDDFNPRTRREKALEQRVPEAERPLYHHLFDEQENRRRGIGWIAAFASVAVVGIGAALAWNNFMSRPAPSNLYERPGLAARGNSGYMTPQQPTSNTDISANIVAPPAPPDAAPPIATPPAATDQQATKDVAATPVPKSVPSEPPPPPKKTISEAAANPGSLGPAANPAPAPPAAKEQPAVAPAPMVTPPPKREAAKLDTPKRETPRKEASAAPRRPIAAPPPQEVAPEDIAPPPLTEPAAAPAVTPPPRRNRPPATGQPQPLTRDAPAAAYAPPPQQRPARQPPQPDNFGPPGTPDTVTIDGVNYVSGQEPRSLGTLAGSPQAVSSNASIAPYAPAMPPQQMAPPAYAPRPYIPTDHEGGAPLPNDVIILPNGQMALPGGGR